MFIPTVFVIAAIVLSQVTLRIDGQLNGEQLPQVLLTTVDSARSILSAIAGGLISSVTLLLSLMLLAVQLASSQFSPRTLREWIGDRTLQGAIGIVLGTVVYCLLILRETRTFAEGEALTPHISVIVAVVLGILSLIAVVRSVDHLTNRLRIGSVASHIMGQTVALIEQDERLELTENPGVVPAPHPTRGELEQEPPDDAFPVVAPRAGWVQQIDSQQIVGAAPKGSTVYVTASVGSFMFPDAPMAWVWPRPEDEDECEAGIRAGFALGDSRTLQQDIGFGILQMVDIALRALSPGVNDPNTANDLIVHLGVVMLTIWQRPTAPTAKEFDGRTLVRHDLVHGDYLHAAFDSIRIYGASDPKVAATMIRTLLTLLAEKRRRNLPGPTDPIADVIAQILDDVRRSDLSDYDKASVTDLAPREVWASAP